MEHNLIRSSIFSLMNLLDKLELKSIGHWYYNDTRQFDHVLFLIRFGHSELEDE